jgi:hypothetical protein
MVSLSEREEIMRMPTHAFLALVSDVLASEEASVDLKAFKRGDGKKRI